MLTRNFIHIYVVVLTVIKIQVRHTVKHNTLMAFNSLLHVSVHHFKTKAYMEHSKETSLTKELHVANVLMIFNFCNSGAC